MPGHAGDVVVEHDGDHVGIVVYDLNRARHAAVKKRGVAHNAEYGVLLPAEGECARHARADGKAAAHAHAGVGRAERGRGAEGIAADVARDDGVFDLGHAVEEPAVRAARTQCGRTRDGLHADVARLRLHAEDRLAQYLGVQLIHRADDTLADAVDTGGAYLRLHKAVQLLNDVKRLDLGGKLADELHGQRICKPQLEERCVLRKDLLGVLIRDGRADNAVFAAAQLHAVERRAVGIVREALHICLDLCTVGVGARRGAHKLLRVLFVRGDLVLLALAKLNKALRVRHARRRAEEHGCVKLLGDAVRLAHEVLALLRVGRLDEGDLCVLGVPAVVLLVLGRVTARVVGRDYDEAAVNAEIGGGENGVRGDVQPDVLHRAQRPRTGDARAVCDLHRDLFVRRPFAVYFIPVLRQILEDLRAGRAGVGGTDVHTGLVSAARNGFVAAHKLLQCIKLPSVVGCFSLYNST